MIGSKDEEKNTSKKEMSHCSNAKSVNIDGECHKLSNSKLCALCLEIPGLCDHAIFYSSNSCDATSALINTIDPPPGSGGWFAQQGLGPGGGPPPGSGAAFTQQGLGPGGGPPV